MLVPIFAACATVIVAAIIIAFAYQAGQAVKDWLDDRKRKG